jgi:soluble lytic murein transglycosylase
MIRASLVPALLVMGLLAATPQGWNPLVVAPGPEAEETLEEVRRELALGRHWHAAELLRAMDRQSPLEPEARYLLAEALAGYRNWAGVLEVLEAADWVSEVAPVRGPYLMGRAHEALGNGVQAAGAYGRAYNAGDSPDFKTSARLARALYRSEGVEAALPVMESLSARQGETGGLVSGLAWEMAGEAAEAGDTAGVRTLLSKVTVPALVGRSRGYPARAALEAGDSVRAEGLYRELLTDAGSSGARARYSERVGTLVLARGDTAAAVDLFLEAFKAAPRSDAGMAAAAWVVDYVDLTPELALDAARSLDRAGDGRRALTAYDAYVDLVEDLGLQPDAGARVERARLAATLPERVEEAVEEFRALDEHPDPAVGVRTLQVWRDLRRRQGETARAQVLRQWLVERYPDTNAAAEIVFLRGDAAQDRGDTQTAIRYYNQVSDMAPTRTLAGLARMRIGQIRLAQGDMEAAAVTFEAYLSRFPTGRRWTEASFWAAHARRELEDESAARAHYERVLDGDPFSYYGAQSAKALGRAYPPSLAPEPGAEDPAWVQDAMIRLDLLREAGLTASAAFHVDRVTDRAGAEGGSSRYALAEGLIDRGWTIEGINQGWALVREGAGWNERLLRIVYPFPNREMVEREAEEWGVDPFLMAGLIRQESAWDRDIVSSAGAVGLMQVMPSTGAQLARASGLDGFSTESLESAEVNLHLGARFLSEMLERFGPELPLVLSAYNAGPTRANRWKDFPEHADPLRFTERIPFTETRGYVKNVTRNRELYRALYADAEVVEQP